jgi:hypothetical protein
MENMASLGPWIRSTQFWRVVMEERDRKYHSNPSQSRNYGQYSPLIPASMLAQMEAMKIQEEQAAEGSRSSQYNQKTQDEGDKCTWHSSKSSDIMEISTTTIQQTMVKSLRMDEEWVDDINNRWQDLQSRPAIQHEDPYLEMSRVWQPKDRKSSEKAHCQASTGHCVLNGNKAAKC